MHSNRRGVSICILTLATLSAAASAEAQNPRRADRIGERLRLPDLQPEVTQSSDLIRPGRSQVYTITVRNEGRTRAPSFQLETNLSLKLTPGDVDETNGFQCADRDLFATSGRKRHCRGPALKPGESASFTVTGHLPKSFPSGQSIGFHVDVDPFDRIAETIEWNNRARIDATSFVPR